MARDPDCIFCKIVAGEIPCCNVYEDESCLAFMDISPLAEGHVYVAWTRNDHYAKFRVVRIEPGEVVFDWAYQTARGNQELSAPGEIQPAGARPPERPEHPDRARGRLATRGRTGGH